MSNKVYIRPVARESVQKRNSYKFVDGVQVGTTKAPGGTFMFQIQANQRGGKLAINLDRQVDNKYYVEKEEDAQLPSAWHDSTIWSKKKISRQEELELKYNRKPGFLHTEAFKHDPSSRLRAQSRSYLQQLTKIFSDGINELNLNEMDDELIYEGVLESNLFANSLEEISTTPGARFYISYIDEEQEKLANKRRRKLEASSLLDKLVTDHKTKLYKVATVLNLVQGSVSEDVVVNKLYDYIEELSFGRIPLNDRITRFIDVAKQAMQKSKVEREKFELSFIAQELINHRVINDFRGRYSWPSKAGTNLEELGRTKEEYMNWLSDTKNTPYLEELKEELEMRK